jgi:hypothetical protein
MENSEIRNGIGTPRNVGPAGITDALCGLWENGSVIIAKIEDALFGAGEERSGEECSEYPFVVARIHPFDIDLLGAQYREPLGKLRLGDALDRPRSCHAHARCRDDDRKVIPASAAECDPEEFHWKSFIPTVTAIRPR